MNLDLNKNEEKSQESSNFLDLTKETEKPSNKGGSKKPMLIIILLLAVGGGIWLFSGNSGESDLGETVASNEVDNSSTAPEMNDANGNEDEIVQADNQSQIINDDDQSTPVPTSTGSTSGDDSDNGNANTTTNSSPSTTPTIAPNTVSSPTPSNKTANELASEVMKGVFGNGAQRKASLGDRYEEVQRIVNSNYNL